MVRFSRAGWCGPRGEAEAYISTIVVKDSCRSSDPIALAVCESRSLEWDPAHVWGGGSRFRFHGALTRRQLRPPQKVHSDDWKAGSFFFGSPRSLFLCLDCGSGAELFAFFSRPPCSPVFGFLLGPLKVSVVGPGDLVI